MYKLFIPVTKGKSKTDIRGYWKDNNITYYDYLKIQKLPYIDNITLQGIGKSYNQLALFYTKNKVAYIFTCKTKDTEILKRVKRISHIGYKGLKTAIKKMINQYNGCTVYIKDNHYLLEVFYN